MIRLIAEAEGSAGTIPALGVPKQGSQAPPGFHVRHDHDLRVYPVASQQVWRPGNWIEPVRLHDGSHAIADARPNRGGRSASARLAPSRLLHQRRANVKVNELIEEAVMAPITRIDVHLITSNRAGAGTIGPVYVGVCR